MKTYFELREGLQEKKIDETVSSNRAMHSHENEAQKKAHAAHMKKKHGVTTKYHGDDEVSYHGPKKNVKKALGNHYGGDHDHAKEEHPHIYKEGKLDELSTDTMKRYRKKAKADIVKRDAKKDMHVARMKAKYPNLDTDTRAHDMKTDVRKGMRKLAKGKMMAKDEGYASAAQRKAAHANMADGGRGHPDKKRRG